MSGDAEPRFDRRATAGYLVAWFALTIVGWGGLTSGDPTVHLGDPAASAARMASRSLDLADALATRTGAIGQLLRAGEWTPEEAREFAIAVHEDVIFALEEQPTEIDADYWRGVDVARANAMVLLAEAGELDAACEMADEIPGIGDAAALLRHAYGDGTLDAASTDLAHIDPILEDWPRERLMQRVALRAGDRDVAQGAARAARERGRSVARTRTILDAIQWVLVLVGALWLAGRIIRREPVGSPLAPAPWTFEDGIAVLIRGEVWGRAIQIAIARLPEAVSASAPGMLLYEFVTPLSSLPLLWLCWRHLLVPARTVDRDPLGLDPRRLAVGTCVGVTLAAIAIEVPGSQAFGWISFGAGFYAPWFEGFDETLVFGSRWQVALRTLDYVVSIPVIEELTFRGLLYFTLRRAMGVAPACLLSAGIFSAVHFYSVSGLAMTFFAGVVWTLVFERTGSLLPGIFAHAVYNALYVASIVSLYR